MYQKKICFIAHDLAGGGMTRTYALAQAAQHAGYRVEILGLKLTRSDIYSVPPAGIPVTEMTGLTLLHRVIKLLKSLEGDIVYAIKPRPSSYGIALINRLFTHCYVILDIDDLEQSTMRASNSVPVKATQTLSIRFFNTAKKLKSRLRNSLNFRRWLNPADYRYIRWMASWVHKADAITVNTRYLHAQYGGKYVPSCKDVQHYNPAQYDCEHSRESIGLADYYVLMFPGTARPHKGLEDILSALALLDRPDLKLVLVGGRSSSEPYIQQLMQQWGKWIVRLSGFTYETMPSIVAAAHIIVVPQRNTAIARAQVPMKLTDAMAMAKPILSTTVGDIPEVLGDTGFLVEPSAPQQLASKLDFIINNPDQARLQGMQARQRFIDHYSLEAIAPILSDIIQSLGAQSDKSHA